MKLNDFNLESAIMRTADRNLRLYISSAAHHLNGAAVFNDRPDSVRLYRSLVKADMRAARSLVSDLEDMDLITMSDWAQIDHWLVWFGIPAEDRPDDE